MKRACIAALLLAAGCGKQEDKLCGLPPEPPPAPRNLTVPAGVVLTGVPQSPELALCDARGRWGLRQPEIEHSIVDPKEKAPLRPAEGNPKLSLYRDSLPFPQVNWKSGDWEVTQLLFPVGKGFAVRYHVMNHGEGARTGKLKISSPGLALAPKLEFDLQVDPGASQFFHVTTPELGGNVPDDALDQATAQWEKLIGKRALKLPDVAVVTEYYSQLAGQLLGVTGCAEAVAKTESMLAKKEGGAIRLLGGIPEAWQLEAIEVGEIPTDFGPLSFRYQGVYNNRTLELKPGCKPPEGFVLAAPPKLAARIDGKDVAIKDGVLRVPAGAGFVELSHPR